MRRQFNILEIIELYISNVRPISELYFVANCPFCHDEDTFVIAIKLDKFYCFGCYSRGNSDRFMTLINKYEKQNGKIHHYHKSS